MITSDHPVLSADSLKASNAWPMLGALIVAPLVFLLVWHDSGQPAFGWDSGWYRSIVNHGYQFNGDITQQQNVAFLPGYPALTYLFQRLSGLSVVAAQQWLCMLGYLVGAACFGASLLRRLGAWRSAAAMLSWSLMPFSSYFMNGYSESVFFALAGAFFVLLDRGHLRSACLVASYALITRPFAAALLGVLGWHLLAHPHIAGDRDGVSPRALIDAALEGFSLAPYLVLFPVLYTVYLWQRFDDPLIYASALQAWGGAAMPLTSRAWAVLLSTVIGFADSLRSFPFAAPYHAAAVLLLANIVALVALWRRGLFELVVFNLGIMAIWWLSSDVANLGRHIAILNALPVAIALVAMPAPTGARGGGGSHRRHLATQLAAALLTLGAAAHFAHFARMYFLGEWVS